LLHSSGSTNKTIEDTPNAIGQTSLGVINLKNLVIKPLSIDGVRPSTETMEQGLYKMIRNYGIIIPQGELPPAVKDFVDFISGNETREILKQYNFLPTL